MVSATKNRAWRPISDYERAGWRFDAECIATLRSDIGRTVVRTNGVSFGVFACGPDGTIRLIKELPTSDRARAYQWAIHRA